jgi:5'-3' exonuclease
MTPVSWSALSGRRVGIDALSFLYKARATNTPLLEMLSGLVRALRAWGIEPLFVFDGKSPREKDGTRSARRRQKQVAEVAEKPVARVSSEDRNEVKQLLYALGVLALNAEEEADPLLAYMVRNGAIAAVISADMDFLPRGVPLLIIPTDLTDLVTWHAASLAHIIRQAKLSYTQFVEMCALMGCDYAPTIPTISYKTAYEALLMGRTMLEILAGEGIRTPTAWIRAVSMLRGEKDTWESLLSVKQREKWAAGPPPAEPDADILLSLNNHCKSHNMPPPHRWSLHPPAQVV